jgi:hypothetical protein
MDSVHGAVDHGAIGPSWTDDHCHVRAHQSSASSRSGARELRPRGGGGEGRARELNGGVTASWVAVEGRLTGGGGFNNGGDGGRAQEWGK